MTSADPTAQQIPDPQAEGEGQTASQGAPLQVKEEELERVGSVAPGGKPLMSEALRTSLYLHPDGVKGLAGEMLVAWVQQLEFDAHQAQLEANSQRRRAETAEKALLQKSDKPLWQDKLRIRIGSGLMVLGFAGCARSVSISSVLLFCASALIVILGGMLVAMPWLPFMWKLITGKES